MSPVVAVTARYKSPAHYCDTVVIRAEITKYTGVRFDVTYKVYDKATQGSQMYRNERALFYQPRRQNTVAQESDA